MPTTKATKDNPLKRREGLRTVYQQVEVRPEDVPDDWLPFLPPEAFALGDPQTVGVKPFVWEMPTFTCAHCSKVVAKNPARIRDSDTCWRCDLYICRACNIGQDLGTPCVPREKRAELALKHQELGLAFMDSGPRGELLFPETLLTDEVFLMGFPYTSVIHSWTPVAHADGAASLANNSYHAIRNAAATDVTKLVKVAMMGEATSSGVNSGALRRNSTNGATPTNAAPGPNSPSAPASSQQQYAAATTGPTIASTRHLAGFGFNAFGGGWREQITPGMEPLSVGTTAPNAEFNLDTVTGTNLVSTDIEFEAV